MRATHLSVVVVVLLLVCAAQLAAETKLGPPPNGYRPMRLALADEPGETLAKQPEYQGTPLYGVLKLGDGEDAEYTVVVDIGDDWTEFQEAYAAAEGKPDLNTCPARIYIDTNNDEDLTNDGEGVLARCSENPRSKGSYTISTSGKCAVVYADGTELEYPMNLYMFPQRGKMKQRDGSEFDYGRTTFFYRGASFETAITVGDKELPARFYDENSNALIMADDGDKLALDLNDDGKFDPNRKGPESLALDQPFYVDGETYVLKSYGARGGDATVAVAEDKLGPPVYIAAGEPAPDFSMATLSGDTFTLSEQEGKIIIIDFWATWCGPCIGELPNVVKMWEDLEDDGLVLLGVSLDRNTDDSTAVETVTKFAEKEKMTWTHIVEGKYWDSEVADLYQVSGIPQTVLVGRDGKIIATGLRGEKLHDAAKEALAE